MPKSPTLHGQPRDKRPLGRSFKSAVFIKGFIAMLDFWMVAIGVAFFAVMIAYTAACDRL
jgi:hypothetical protein